MFLQCMKQFESIKYLYDYRKTSLLSPLNTEAASDFSPLQFKSLQIKEKNVCQIVNVLRFVSLEFLLLRSTK